MSHPIERRSEPCDSRVFDDVKQFDFGLKNSQFEAKQAQFGRFAGKGSFAGCVAEAGEITLIDTGGFRGSFRPLPIDWPA